MACNSSTGRHVVLSAWHSPGDPGRGTCGLGLACQPADSSVDDSSSARLPTVTFPCHYAVRGQEPVLLNPRWGETLSVHSGRTKFQPDSSSENNWMAFWPVAMAATQYFRTVRWEVGKHHRPGPGGGGQEGQG